MRSIIAEPLTAEAFASFGMVLENRGPDRRAYCAVAFEAEAPAQPCLWVNRDTPRVSLPLLVTRLERHPWSAQSFVPLGAGRYLIIVAHAIAAGAPDPLTMRAFVAAGQGVCYRRNIWHHGMAVLDEDASFVVMMATMGHADDDVFLDLADPVRIVPVRVDAPREGTTA